MSRVIVRCGRSGLVGRRSRPCIQVCVLLAIVHRVLQPVSAVPCGNSGRGTRRIRRLAPRAAPRTARTLPTIATRAATIAAISRMTNVPLHEVCQHSATFPAILGVSCRTDIKSQNPRCSANNALLPESQGFTPTLRVSFTHSVGLPPDPLGHEAPRGNSHTFAGRSHCCACQH